MKQFSRVKLSNLRNEEWFNFYTEFRTFVEQHSAEELNIERLYATFITLYTNADEALEKIAKSGLTDEMTALDARRDDNFRGLKAAVKSASTHFDADKKAAATHLDIVFNHYGNLAAKPINEETSALYNFVQELRGKYVGYVQTLGVEDWVDELERSNNDFKNAVLARTQEGADKTDLQLLVVRRQTDRAYLDIIERIEAQITLEDPDSESRFAGFVKLLNTNIERYRNALNRRSSKKLTVENSIDNIKSKI